MPATTLTRIASSLSLAGALLCTACSSGPQAKTWDPGQTWPFQPAADDFRPDALLDLRYLNERTAGESGYLKTDGKGGFALGNGKPVRLWAVLTDVGRDRPFTPRPLGRQTEPDLARHARFLAKRGVNMVRLHTQLSPDLSRPLNECNEETRDWIWRAVAAMKKEGIYTTVSPYWMVPMKFSQAWGIPGEASQSAAGLLFFDPTLQAAYKSWLRQLLAPVNPHTGIPLAKDTGLGILQIQNEDSLLFWTVDSIQGPQKRNLGKRFGDWLVKKYGTHAAVQQRWQGDKLAGDDPTAGVYDFHKIWEMTQARTGGQHARLTDQLQFWSETMYRFNAEIERFVREELGCKALMNAGNWRTADSVRLMDAERWSYTANAVDAVNRYYTGVHQGPNTGWAIVKGDKFTSPSVLTDPRPLPTNLKQTKNRPMLITESTWVMPMAYSTEGTFLVSAYQSLNGVDGFYWFATGDDEWTPPQSGNGYLASQAMWVFGSPDMLGTFPAAALSYRMGYVKQGPPVVEEHRSLDDIWERRTPIAVEEPGFDPNRDAGDIAPTSSVKTAVDPLAFLVGPIQVVFGSDAKNTKVVDPKPHIRDGVVTSNTGQILLDSNKGFCRVDAPCTQGVAAFFGSQRRHVLSDVVLESGNEYGAAMVVSMDGKPIKSSKKVLVQFGTRSRPTGWQERPTSIKTEGGQSVEGFEVVDHGQAPWRVQSADLSVTVKNPGLKTATVLDMNGNAAKPLVVERVAGGLRFKFPANAMYVVLR